MTIEEIQAFLDNTKVYVNGKSRKIQKKLFSFGYTWPGNDPTKVDCEDKPFLFIHKEGYISYGDDMNFFKEHKNKEISADEILSLKITEPSYRPFNTKEECWNEMLKHHPFGWVYDKVKNDYNLRINISEHTAFERLFNEYNFADGTPFGVEY